MTDLRSPSDTRLLEAFQELGPVSPVDSAIPGVTGEAVLGSLLVKMGAGTRAFLLSSLCPEEFEKDDADLGHVDFATVAANLR
jgi:Ubiquitin-activating enzyme active site